MQRALVDRIRSSISSISSTLLVVLVVLVVLVDIAFVIVQKHRKDMNNVKTNLGEQAWVFWNKSHQLCTKRPVLG